MSGDVALAIVGYLVLFVVVFVAVANHTGNPLLAILVVVFGPALILIPWWLIDMSRK